MSVLFNKKNAHWPPRHIHYSDLSSFSGSISPNMKVRIDTKIAAKKMCNQRRLRKLLLLCILLAGLLSVILFLTQGTTT